MHTRGKVIRAWLDALVAEGNERIRALEVGRVRDAAEEVGYSTLHIAAHPSVAVLVSVDHAKKTQAVACEVLPAAALAKVKFVNAKSDAFFESAVPVGTCQFDFAYLDGQNDAQVCMRDLQGALMLASPGAVVILDDTDSRFAEKGNIAVPWAEAHDDIVDIVQRVPADTGPERDCQGMLVMRLRRPT